LFEALNAGAFAWTNIEFVVSATGTSSSLEFVFRNDYNAFGLDDVSVQPLPAPALEPPTLANGVISLTWSTVPGASYQVQYTENLTTAIWHNLGSAVPATSGTQSTFDSAAPSPSSPQKFYRIVIE
jgi:hypothetical protein